MATSTSFDFEQGVLDELRATHPALVPLADKIKSLLTSDKTNKKADWQALLPGRERKLASFVLRRPLSVADVNSLGYDDYAAARKQYAFSSYSKEDSFDTMAPKWIFVPTDVDDVMAVVNYVLKTNALYVKENQQERMLAIAVRSGGHQYAGKSSTAGNNVMIDMGYAFVGEQKQVPAHLFFGFKMLPYAQPNYFEFNGHQLAQVSVSIQLVQLLESLNDHGMFVPMGQCANVHIGGHAQTGGYGQMLRAFGIFSDYIVRFDAVLANAETNEAELVHVACAAQWEGEHTTQGYIFDPEGGSYLPETKTVKYVYNQDLVDAFLGGCPGSFGVLLNITIKPHLNKNHARSYGLKAMFRYDTSIFAHNSCRRALRELMEIIIKTADMPRGFDMCATIFTSAKGSTLGLVREMNRSVRNLNSSSEDYALCFGFPIVMIYAQYINNVEGNEPESNESKEMPPHAKEWFTKIKRAIKMAPRTVSASIAMEWYFPGAPTAKHPVAPSELLGHWMYPAVREYRCPFVKRLYLSGFNDWLTSTERRDKFCETLIERYEVIIKQPSLHAVIQLQSPLPPAHAWNSGAHNKTQFNFRYSMLGLVTDAFHDDNPKALAAAQKWCAENDDIFGPGDAQKPGKQILTARDGRLFWGSYFTEEEMAAHGGNLDALSKKFFATPERYEHIRSIKDRVDSHSVFSPNNFALISRSTPNAPAWQQKLY